MNVHQYLQATVPQPPNWIDSSHAVRAGRRRRTRRRLATLTGCLLLAGTAAETALHATRPADRLAVVADAAASGPRPAAWDPSGTTLVPPQGWKLYSEDHETVPPVAGENVTSHSWRYTPRLDTADAPQAASLELNVLAGTLPSPAGESSSAEPDAVLLHDLREQPVTLVRQQAQQQGLTIFEWQEAPDLRVTVLARGNIDRDVLERVVTSVVVSRPAA